ncbi:MAG TPA: hypothetical protein VH575_12530 [Gemmataceae bacterium]|jgi:hypothetical protein
MKRTLLPAVFVFGIGCLVQAHGSPASRSIDAEEGSAVTLNVVDGEKLSEETCIRGPGIWRLSLIGKLENGKLKKQLVYVRFGKLLRASSRTDMAIFWENVELLILPNEDLRRKIDFEAVREKCPKGGLYLRCDQLKVHVLRQGWISSLQIEAKGRVVSRTPEHTSRSDTFVYNEAKDQIILVGEPERRATLERIFRRGQQPDVIRGQKISFIRGTGQVWAAN